MSAQNGAQSAAVVGPDDVLVLSFPAHMTREEFEGIADAIRAELPHLEGRLLFIAGAAMAVVKDGMKATREENA